MSIKDVKRYYAQIEQQYFEMNQTAKELNEECAKGNIPQSMVDQAQAMCLPLKQNYERLSYIIYLLNKPNRHPKNNWYEKQNSSIRDFSNRVKSTENDCYEESADALVNFKKYVKQIQEDL